jgi:osomolarity two-component system sensor histidine kinase SLN1
MGLNRKYGGTGLGLAICRAIAQIMNGSIEVESNIGTGTIFTYNVNFA